MYTLTCSQREADQKLSEAQSLRSRLSDEATERANQMIKDKTVTLQAKYKAKETALVSYVAIFGFLTAVVTILSLIRQKTFWGDFRAFWIGFWNILVSVATLIGKGITYVATLCDMIPQRNVAVVVHWIVFIVLLIGLGALIAFGFMKLIEFSAEPVINGITPWNCSVSVIALVAVVFFGDYIKNIIKFNLFGIWFILTIILIGVGIYLMSGRTNRRYY
jgi:sterol desaturase/sphingolipid hydroxylase (fatty acid hydroxylase superfamily)